MTHIRFDAGGWTMVDDQNVQALNLLANEANIVDTQLLKVITTFQTAWYGCDSVTRWREQFLKCADREQFRGLLTHWLSEGTFSVESSVALHIWNRVQTDWQELRDLVVLTSKLKG